MHNENMEKQAIAILPLAFGALAAMGIYSGAKNMYEGFKKIKRGKKGGGWQMAGGALQAGISTVPTLGGFGGKAVSLAGKGVGRLAPAGAKAAIGRVGSLAAPKFLPFVGGTTLGGAAHGAAALGTEIGTYSAAQSAADSMLRKGTGMQSSLTPAMQQVGPPPLGSAYGNQMYSPGINY
jgi:hypothetical protein